MATVDSWVAAMRGMNANMTRFNQLMLNKLQLYAAPQLFLQILRSFEAAGVPTLRRSSRDTVSDRPVAHLSFEQSGHVFEIVTDGIDLGWPLWEHSECPLAHRVVSHIKPVPVDC